MPTDDLDCSIAALSPSYWSHIPLCIGQINTKDANGRLLTYNNHNPFTRGHLVGLLVAKHVKETAIHYVLDDGSGLLDCVEWTASRLPSLLWSHEDGCNVGDWVQVWGRFEYVGHAENGEVVVELQVNEMVRVERVRDEVAHLQRLVQSAESYVAPETVLEWLGPCLSRDIRERRQFPAANDRVGAWRLFGPSCPCRDTIVKRDLLYCHCLATPLEQDGDFQFRDALLEWLLSRREEGPLWIGYRNVKDNLSSFSKAGMNSDLLLRKTMSMLRKDGIVHLWDAELDIYLLVCAPRVLLPHAKLLQDTDGLLRTVLKRNPPPFVQAIPKARLQLVRRMLDKEGDGQR